MRIVAKRLFMSMLAAILVVSLLPMSAMAGEEELEGSVRSNRSVCAFSATA